MIKSVNEYFLYGCGRCALFKTPECRVHLWEKELAKLRELVLESGLKETLKWKHPCYAYEGKNVLVLGAFKNYCSIAFFKGSLINDNQKLLEASSENTQSMRQFKFMSVGQIVKYSKEIRAYIQEAIEMEKQGVKPTKIVQTMVVPEELASAFKKNKGLKEAFYELTPGRQRGYIIHFSSAKQAATREARVEKYIGHILAHKGIDDR